MQNPDRQPRSFKDLVGDCVPRKRDALITFMSENDADRRPVREGCHASALEDAPVSGGTESHQIAEETDRMAFTRVSLSLNPTDPSLVVRPFKGVPATSLYKHFLCTLLFSWTHPKSSL